MIYFFSFKAFQFLLIFRKKKNGRYIHVYIFLLCFPNDFCHSLSSLFSLLLSFSLNTDFISKKLKWSKISKSSIKVLKVFGLKHHTVKSIHAGKLFRNSCTVK